MLNCKVLGEYKSNAASRCPKPMFPGSGVMGKAYWCVPKCQQYSTNNKCATPAQRASRLHIHGHGHLVKEAVLVFSAPSQDVSLNPLKGVSGLISLVHQ